MASIQEITEAAAELSVEEEKREGPPEPAPPPGGKPLDPFDEKERAVVVKALALTPAETAEMGLRHIPSIPSSPDNFAVRRRISEKFQTQIESAPDADVPRTCKVMLSKFPVWAFYGQKSNPSACIRLFGVEEDKDGKVQFDAFRLEAATPLNTLYKTTSLKVVLVAFRPSEISFTDLAPTTEWTATQKAFIDKVARNNPLVKAAMYDPCGWVYFSTRVAEPPPKTKKRR